MRKVLAFLFAAAVVSMFAVSAGPARAEEGGARTGADRAAVSAQLTVLGYTAAEARERVDALTPEEMQVLSENPGQVNAAGQPAAIIGAVAIIILLVFWYLFG